METTNKQCAKCGIVVSKRKKFCSDSCKYWFNEIKKDREKGLPPVKKRNKEWCYVFVSIGNTMSLRGQGKRSGGLVKGSMSANVSFTVEKLMQFNFENMKKHFEKKFNHTPSYIRLGDGTRMSKSEAESFLINQDYQIAAAHG